jgi:hypothetical protein
MTKQENRKIRAQRWMKQRFSPLIGAFLLTTMLMAGCNSSHSTLAYPPTGTPTPRPDALYVLDYLYIPGQPPAGGPNSRARRVLDPVQIQHFYEMANALPPYPLATSTTAQCYSDVTKGFLLFFLHGQPTLEVDIEDQCQGLNAFLYGFVAGNPPKIGFFASTGLAIASDKRMANNGFVQEVQQAFQSGAPTPVQDIPYQPPPHK